MALEPETTTFPVGNGSRDPSGEDPMRLMRRNSAVARCGAGRVWLVGMREHRMGEHCIHLKARI